MQANCLGSKVANVGLGLGASWTLSSALGHDVKVCSPTCMLTVFTKRCMGPQYVILVFRVCAAARVQTV